MHLRKDCLALLGAPCPWQELHREPRSPAAAQFASSDHQASCDHPPSSGQTALRLRCCLSAQRAAQVESPHFHLQVRSVRTSCLTSWRSLYFEKTRTDRRPILPRSVHTSKEKTDFASFDRHLCG